MYKKYLKQLISILFVGGGVYYLYRSQDAVYVIQSLDYKIFIILIIYSIIPYMIEGVTFKYEMKLFRISLQIKEWFGLTAVNSMYNYFLPARGGIIARAYYLKTKYGFEYSKNASLLSGFALLYFLLSSVLAVLFIFLNASIYGIYYFNLFWISVGIFIVTVIIVMVFWFFPKFTVKTGWLRLDSFICNIIEGFSFFKSDKKTVLTVAVIQLLKILLMSLRLFFLFKITNINVNFVDVIIIKSLVTFSMIISLTPGNLGIQEGIIGLISSIMGVPINEALMIAAIERAIGLIIIFSFGGIFHFVLMRDKSLALTK